VTNRPTPRLTSLYLHLHPNIAPETPGIDDTAIKFFEDVLEVRATIRARTYSAPTGIDPRQVTDKQLKFWAYVARDTSQGPYAPQPLPPVKHDTRP
jgi:hypothetical protein